LVVEGVDLRRAAVHEEEDDPPGPRRMMGDAARFVRGCQGGQREGSEARRDGLQQLTPGKEIAHALLPGQSTKRNSALQKTLWQRAAQASSSRVPPDFGNCARKRRAASVSRGEGARPSARR